MILVPSGKGERKRRERRQSGSQKKRMFPGRVTEITRERKDGGVE